MLRRILLLALLPTCLAAAFAQDAQVTASVDSETLGMQDQLQLTIRISGDGEAEPPRLPRLQGFEVAAGPSVSTQFQWINGRTSSSKSFTYVLLPQKPGQYAIDPIEVRVGGKTYRTQTLTVTVTQTGSRSPRSRTVDPSWNEGIFPRGQRTGEDLFVTADVDRKRVYTGQQTILTYRLSTQVGVTGLQLQESPPLNGFWVEEMEIDPNPRGERKTFNGREYVEYVIKKQALFPNAPGKLKVPAVTFAISARTGGDFFGVFSQSETLYRKTGEQAIEVLPFPAEGRPADFSGAVGSYNLTASLDKTEAAVGDAITLRVKLSGRGNLKTVPDIVLPQLPEFTIYSSKQTANLRALEGRWIGGDKTWEYVLVPKAPGDQSIPPLTFAYFDPERERYESLSTTPLPLKVSRPDSGGGLMTALSGVAKQNLTRQGTDISFIKLFAGDLRPGIKPVYRSFWYYLLLAVPVVVNVGLLIQQRERKKALSDVTLARSRKARRHALARLASAGKAGRSDQRRFYDEAAAALSGYLGDKFGLPEIALASDQLERTLSEKAVSEETIRQVIGCLQECDFGRFVTASDSPEKNRDLTRRIRAIIAALEGR